MTDDRYPALRREADLAAAERQAKKREMAVAGYPAMKRRAESYRAELLLVSGLLLRARAEVRDHDLGRQIDEALGKVTP